MTVNILAFGIAKEIFGSSAISLDLPEDSTTQDLKQLLERKYPRLEKLASYLLAVNSEYAMEATKLRATDEIAVIPPVSGG